ncbi:uncharacterized protein LOC131067807 [Cryptomeria japonica]|uniref:uncharacterized protein LOC131067807 n=1 Tax=Cryptomeria japonica TaxID=3369 RepID=UPI0025AD1F01|nr:uncharacterized protein LOC131067807 [Cryptomeria japonica]
MEIVNEVKKDENSNNEKQDSVFSNNQIESSKEGKQGTKLNNKYNPEVQEVGSVSQKKEEASPNEAVPISSLSKLVEENYNEDQECNSSDIEPLLLLTNGSPKPPLCKTPSHSMVVDILERNLQILSSKEGKMNKEDLNGGISTRNEEVGIKEESSDNESDNESPIHSECLGKDNSHPMEDVDYKDNEEIDANSERERNKETKKNMTKESLSEDKENNELFMDNLKKLTKIGSGEATPIGGDTKRTRASVKKAVAAFAKDLPNIRDNIKELHGISNTLDNALEKIN